MAFVSRNLSVLAYAQGFTLWHYASRADTLQQVGQGGFFDGAAELLAVGDMMLVSASDGGRAGMIGPDAAGRMGLQALG